MKHTRKKINKHASKERKKKRGKGMKNRGKILQAPDREKQERVLVMHR